MADDNVVRGAFGKSKTKGPQTPSAAPRTYGETLKSLKDGPMGSFLKEAGMSAMIQLVVIQEHLNSLGGYVPNQAQIRELEILLGNHTDAELVALIESGSESDWNIKPAFYQALVNVYKQRKF